jgi:hypothetical protein
MTVTYDIFFLGLADPTAAGRDRFFDAMEHLTKKRAMSFEPILRNPTEPLLRTVDQSTAEAAVQTLHQAGAWIELRPTSSSAGMSGMDDMGGGMAAASADSDTCPSCGHVQIGGFDDCQSCGVVFAKLEREQVQKEIRDRRLDEALQKAMSQRQEWDEKAKAYLDKRPLPATATTPFERDLFQAEIPFEMLAPHDGHILMTSRRIMFEREGKVGSIPYEMISDVDVGGGLAVSKNRVKMQFTFRCELPLPGGTAKNISWQIDKESSQKKDVIMDWVFSRRFICGSCGQPDLDFRRESSKTFCRCMRCATDHEVDLDEAVVIPIFID